MEITDEFIAKLCRYLKTWSEKSSSGQGGQRWTVFYDGRLTNAELAHFVNVFFSKQTAVSIHGFTSETMCGILHREGKSIGVLSINNDTKYGIKDLVILADLPDPNARPRV